MPTGLKLFQRIRDMDIDRAIKNYTQLDETPLCLLMHTYKSDKGKAQHHYTRFYTSLFEPIRNEPLNLFEMGLGTNDVTVASNMGLHGTPGASHSAWEAYFPNARIYGADIDKKTLFETDRIKTYFCDQTSRSRIQEMWSHPDLKDTQFQIIIDDGLHALNGNKTFFESSIHKLAVGGVFIIEDIGLEYPIGTMKGVVERWSRKYPNMKMKLVWIQRADNRQPADNWLFVCKRIRE